MCARTGLWEPRVGNGPGPPGLNRVIPTEIGKLAMGNEKGTFFDVQIQLICVLIKAFRLRSTVRQCSLDRRCSVGRPARSDNVHKTSQRAG